jgi:hypothetical protein
MPAIALCGLLLLSMYLNSVSLVFADYTVPYASFPPDNPGDVDNNGIVDMLDLYMVAVRFGSTFSITWEELLVLFLETST